MILQERFGENRGVSSDRDAGQRLLLLEAMSPLHHYVGPENIRELNTIHMVNHKHNEQTLLLCLHFFPCRMQPQLPSSTCL